MFCVECGKDTDKLIDGMCLDCYLHGKTFFNPPSAITIRVCRECGAVHIGKHWHYANPGAALTQHVRQVMSRADLDQQQFVLDREHDVIVCSGIFQHRPIRETHPLKVRERASLCEECGKVKSGYFEALVQVRKQGGDLTSTECQVADIIVSEEAVVDGRNYLARREPHHGGVDYYLGDKSRAAAIARRLVDVFDATVDTSYTLMGMRDGQEIHRNTILVRLSSYTKGDFVELDGAVFQVVETGKRVTLRNLSNGASRHVYRSEMADIPVLSITPQEAVVASREKREVQTLDPDTYETITIMAPSVSSEKDTIPVIKWKDKLYAIGD